MSGKSSQLAAETNRFTLWDPAAPFPAMEDMPDLPVVTHVQVERAQAGGFHYLHEPAIARHRGKFFACWANHPIAEVNSLGEMLRGSTSDDGIHWSPPELWLDGPMTQSASINHAVLAEHGGHLWLFASRWIDEVPGTQPFVLNDSTGKWEPRGDVIPGFVPFHRPMKLRDGNYILGGEESWWEAAVAISHGDDFSRWTFKRLPRPADMKLKYPETALIEQGDRLIAICRPWEQPTAPASVSKDGGQTWTTLAPSNFPLQDSKPQSGLLSTGQYYLITNNLDADRRALLSIAVTAPGERLFSRIYKIRHQTYPRLRHFGGYGLKPTSMAGSPTEWSYPASIEHEGNLFVIYTQGKEDCALSIIPVSTLK